MNIHDRSNWPRPGSNPLVLMLQRGDDWYSNKEINVALDGNRAPSRSPLASWPKLREMLEDGDTVLDGRFFASFELAPRQNTGGTARYFSRKAFVLICLRAQSVNAAAFRDWLSGQIAASIPPL